MTKTKTQHLKGGSFNLRYGRQKAIVKDEVERLLTKHDLDFLAVQEAKDYTDMLKRIKGYNYYTWETGGRGADENGFLVRDTLKVDKVKGKFFGDGWTTVTGAFHVPSVMNTVRVDGWLHARTLHLPTPTNWVNGKLNATDERKDDYVACMKGLWRFLRPPSIKNARIALGDWNEIHSTQGEYSPGWLAKATNSKAFNPTSRAGHGRIDWVMAKGCVINNVRKDLDIAEASDHEPVVFSVTKTPRFKLTLPRKV